MNDTGILMVMIITEAILLLSFFTIYLLTKTKQMKITSIILYIIGGAPLLYMGIDHLASDYPDANIGLGFVFYYTWIYAAVALAVAILLLIRKKRG